MLIHGFYVPKIWLVIMSGTFIRYFEPIIKTKWQAPIWSFLRTKTRWGEKDVKSDDKKSVIILDQQNLVLITSSSNVSIYHENVGCT